MIVIPQHLYERLVANGHAPDGTDHVPVVKFFDPAGAATWLITEVSPDDPDQLFGLCDLGMGSPELGCVRLSEIAAIRGPGGLTIERDEHFKPTKSLTAYAAEARLAGRLVA